MESCIGALYLDTGFNLKHVWKTVLFLLDPIVSFSKLQLNPLRELYELCQSNNWELQFSSSKRDGKFTVEAKVDEGNVSASASSTDISGKAARRMAARELFESLKVIFQKTFFFSQFWFHFFSALVPFHLPSILEFVSYNSFYYYAMAEG